MLENLTGWTLAGAIVFLAICFVARVAVFLASCALADAGEPRLGKAAVLALVVLALGIPICWWLFLFLETRLPNSDTTLVSPAQIVGALLSCVVYWAVPAVVYKFLLPASWKKGVLVAGLEVLLGSLLAALIAGVLLVILAGVQVARRPAQAAAPAVAEMRLPLT